jgi:hypothetical protein
LGSETSPIFTCYAPGSIVFQTRFIPEGVDMVKINLVSKLKKYATFARNDICHEKSSAKQISASDIGSLYLSMGTKDSVPRAKPPQKS